jgi:hypothetical protein
MENNNYYVGKPKEYSLIIEMSASLEKGDEAAG